MTDTARVGCPYFAGVAGDMESVGFVLSLPTSLFIDAATTPGVVDFRQSLSSQTTENFPVSVTLITDSSYLTGTNLTYSGARGSSALKITGTYTGLGGFSAIYAAVATSGAQVTDGHGVIGVKCVVTNTAAMTDGEVYGGQFIAKHNHASNKMANQASLIGLEAWAYISAAGTVGTAIGANFAIHNECSGVYGAGSVHRVVQIICDNASGAGVPVESTGLEVWCMAGTWSTAIRIEAASGTFTKGIYFYPSGTVTTGIDFGNCLTAMNYSGTPDGGGSFFVCGSEGTPTAMAANDPGAAESWNGIGIFVKPDGATGRAGNVCEDHGIYVYIEETGETYFLFGLQANGYAGNGASVREDYGIFGRARIKSGGNVGGGSVGAAIGVCGQFNLQSGGTLDITGAGIAAGGRFEYKDDGGTVTSGYRCALFAQLYAGTSDSVLYILAGGGTTTGGMIEFNCAGTVGSAFDFHTGVDGTIVSTAEDSENVSHKIAVNVQGVGTRYIHLFTD